MKNEDIAPKGTSEITSIVTSSIANDDEMQEDILPAEEEKVRPRMVKGTAVSDEGEAPSLKEVIEKQATEDESPQAFTFTLKKILGGDILTTQTIR